MENKLKATARVLEVMDTLREQCPWDREQTFSSLRNNTIEEVYELVGAITDGNMELKINSFIGSMNEDIDIEKDGKDILIGFNPKFFIDALRVIDEEEVSLYMVNPKAPCFIKDDEGKFIYLILPVNFSNV